jgi:hypothetical protein
LGLFYFDESIHGRAGFIFGAFVYSDEPLEAHVNSSLVAVGLRPGVDEYKSRTRADSSPNQAGLRGRLRSLIGQLGLVVAPSTDHDLRGRDALLGLLKIVGANAFLGPSHTVAVCQHEDGAAG